MACRAARRAGSAVMVSVLLDVENEATTPFSRDAESSERSAEGLALRSEDSASRLNLSIHTFGTEEQFACSPAPCRYNLPLSSPSASHEQNCHDHLLAQGSSFHAARAPGAPGV